MVSARMWGSPRTEGGWIGSPRSTRSRSNPKIMQARRAECRIWHSVNSRFSPPEFLSHSRQEQVAHANQDQVAFQALVAPALVLVQTDLGLLVFETALDPPSRERDQEHRLDRRPHRRVADEELQLGGVQHVAGDDQ